MKKGQNYFFGAAILTAGTLIMKVLGAIYKIPLGNILGDEGYSMFMGAYSIYNIFFTLAISGLPVALSRLIAESDANGRVRNEEKTFQVARLTFTAIGLVFALIMFIFPHWLAGSYLENPDAAMSIRAMSPAILLVCIVSAYRGYCQGNGNMIPTTVDEVLEVLFKVVSGLILASVLIKSGKGLPSGSAGAILGVSIGSVVSLGYMIIYKHRNYSSLAAPYTGRHLAEKNNVPDTSEKGEKIDNSVDSTATIIKAIFSIGIPIALGSCIMALFNSIDSKLCMNRLQSAAGFDYTQAKILYGVYGKAQNLFNLPAAFITPLTIAIVPAISGAISRGEREEASKVAQDSMRISAAISMPMGVGLSVLARPIMNVLYPNSNAAGPKLLMIMGVASFFVCTMLMQNAVLQASGHEKLPMISMILGGIVKIGVNWILVAQPSVNIYGAPVGTLASYVVMALTNHIFMCKVLDKKPNLIKIFSSALLSSLIMGAVTWGVYALMSRILSGTSLIMTALSMMAAMIAAVAVYVFCAVHTKALTMEDMKLIPKGEKIGKLLRMK